MARVTIRMMRWFCSVTDKRLLRPWVEGGYRYAGDRASIIRVPCKSVEKTGPLVPVAAARQLFKKWMRKGGVWIRADDLVVNWSRGFAVLGGVRLSGYYTKLITSLPNAVIRVPSQARRHSPIPFRFDGEEGLVMPLGLEGAE